MTTTAVGERPRAKLSPRKRAQRVRLVQYAVLALVVLLVVMTADGRMLQQVFLRPDLVVRLLLAARNVASGRHAAGLHALSQRHDGDFRGCR